MKKSTVHQIHKFWLQSKTRRIATTAKKIKTAVIMKEKTAITIGTAATTKTAIMVKTMAVAAEVPKVFKKKGYNYGRRKNCNCGN